MTRDENVEKVVGAIEDAEAAELVSENGRLSVELSTGVVLKLRPVPRHFMYEATRRFTSPQVPVVFIEDKGREEENPSDPEYIGAVQKYLADISNAATDVALLRGTEIEHKPEEVPGPDSKEFLEEMEYLKIGMLDNKRARYLYWIKSFAAPMPDDIDKLLSELGRLTGVAENDVDEAVRRFRYFETRDADSSATDE